MSYIPTTSDHFCAYTPYELISVNIGHEGVCDIRVTDTGLKNTDYNTSLCAANNGIWQGSNRDGYRKWGSCRSATEKTQDACFVDQCIGAAFKGVPCYSYCYDASITTQTICDAGVNTTWWTWNGMQSGNPQSACVLDGKTLQQCVDSGM